MHRLWACIGLVLVLGLIGPSLTYGQSMVGLFGSARTSALGYAATALSKTAGVQSNPASPATHHRRVVSFYARENYGLSPLRYAALYGTWPAAWGAVSVGASTFGGDGYREIQYSLGYARGLQLGTSRRIHVGATVRYYHTQIENYGGAGALGLHLGVLVRLLPALQLGAHATNVNAPSLVEDEPLPQTLSVGLRYQVHSRFLVVMDVFKDRSFPGSLRGGVELHPISTLALRAGITSPPTRFTGGLGIYLGPVRAHIAAEQHLQLGWSPSASLEVRW